MRSYDLERIGRPIAHGMEMTCLGSLGIGVSEFLQYLGHCSWLLSASECFHRCQRGLDGSAP